MIDPLDDDFAHRGIFLIIMISNRVKIPSRCLLSDDSLTRLPITSLVQLLSSVVLLTFDFKLLVYRSIRYYISAPFGSEATWRMHTDYFLLLAP